MENNFTKSTLSKLKTLGIYHIAGGIIGVALTVWIILKLTIISGPTLLLVLVILGLYAHSIYCGALLLEKRISGLNHSLVNQCLQIVSFSIFGFTFQYVSGFFLSVGLDLTNSFYITANAGISSWQITINDDAGLLILNFNIIALFLAIFIFRLKKKIQQDEIENKITSIGQG